LSICPPPLGVSNMGSGQEHNKLQIEKKKSWRKIMRPILRRRGGKCGPARWKDTGDTKVHDRHDAGFGGALARLQLRSARRPW
jgi:hypothetical protein